MALAIGLERGPPPPFTSFLGFRSLSAGLEEGLVVGSVGSLESVLGSGLFMGKITCRFSVAPTFESLVASSHRQCQWNLKGRLSWVLLALFAQCPQWLKNRFD